jgi:UDP-N-acetylmuramate dehydrogenase
MDLRELTTIRVGGAAAEFFAPQTREQLIETARSVWATGGDWIALGGGSNLVVADEGVPGTVIHVVTRGIERLPGEDLVVRVQAGEPWDGLVAAAVEQGLAGIEALSGIPGSCGAAPIQNIGAYGQETISVGTSCVYRPPNSSSATGAPLSKVVVRESSSPSTLRCRETTAP